MHSDQTAAGSPLFIVRNETAIAFWKLRCCDAAQAATSAHGNKTPIATSTNSAVPENIIDLSRTLTRSHLRSWRQYWDHWEFLHGITSPTTKVFQPLRHSVQTGLQWLHKANPSPDFQHLR